MDLVDLVGRSPSPWQSRSSMPRDVELETSTRTTSPKRRRRSSSSTASSRSSASSETSKSASLVTRKTDALENLHAREEPVEEVRDRRPRAAAAARASPTAKKRGSPSGTLTRAKRSSPDSGIAGEDAEAEREAGDVREGLTGADPERGQDREDLALEARRRARASSSRIEVVDLRDHDPLVGERRTERLPPELRLALGQLEHALADQRRAPTAASARPPSERRSPTPPGPSAPRRGP